MKNYVKLLNFEFNRFVKLYGILIILTIVSQLSGAFFSIRQRLAGINDAIFNSGMSPESYIVQYGKINMFDLIYSYTFVIPIAISITALLFYTFFIWYRDWFSKNTFIYRLLMLPINRMTLFWSKLSLIMLTVLGLVSLQLVLLNIQNIMFKAMVPNIYREDVFIRDLTTNFDYLNVIIPNVFIEFLIAYAIGLLFVTVVFTAILFERSSRIKGAIVGALYCFFSFLLFVSPFIFSFIKGKVYLYVTEYVLIMVGLWLIIFISSLLISRYLINRKITV